MVYPRNAPAPASTDSIDEVAGQLNEKTRAALAAYVSRICSHKEEIAGLNADVSDIYKEAAGNGFDKAALKQVVAIKMADPSKREKMQQADDALSVYLVALGLDK